MVIIVPVFYTKLDISGILELVLVNMHIIIIKNGIRWCNIITYDWLLPQLKKISKVLVIICGYQICVSSLIVNNVSCFSSICSDYNSLYTTNSNATCSALQKEVHKIST